MKRKLSAILAALGAVSLLCGFDSTETVDSIMQKQKEATESSSSTDADIALNADIAIDFAGAPLNAAASGTIDIELITETPALKLEGSIDVLSPLLAQENTYDFKLYMKTREQGTPDIYLYYANSVSGDSVWDHEVGEGINMNDLFTLTSSIDLDSLSSLGITFTLSPEAVNVDGMECYELSTQIDSETFAKVLEEASSLYGQDLSEDENVSMAMELLDGLYINICYYIDTTSYLPVKMHIDMNDSDLSALEQLVSVYMASMMGSEEELAVDIAIHDLSVDASTVYNTITEIVIPDEALYCGYSTDVIPDNMEAEITSTVNSVASSVSP